VTKSDTELTKYKLLRMMPAMTQIGLDRNWIQIVLRLRGIALTTDSQPLLITRTNFLTEYHKTMATWTKKELY